MTRQGSEPAHYGKSRPVVPSRRVGALKRASSISCNQMQFDQLKRLKRGLGEVRWTAGNLVTPPIDEVLQLRQKGGKASYYQYVKNT